MGGIMYLREWSAVLYLFLLPPTPLPEKYRIDLIDSAGRASRVVD
jgi:hypothetical protein